MSAVSPIAVQIYRPGGNLSALNVSAAAAIKASPGTLFRIVVNVAGTAGSLTFNDCATTGAATSANEILTIGYAALTVGEVITLAFPCLTGITLSAIPTGGVIAVAYS